MSFDYPALSGVYKIIEENVIIGRNWKSHMKNYMDASKSRPVSWQLGKEHPMQVSSAYQPGPYSRHRLYSAVNYI